jgi:hypothetical protein
VLRDVTFLPSRLSSTRASLISEVYTSLKFSAALIVAGVVLASPLTSAATTCDSVAACALGNNTDSGVGLESVSQLNVALYGVSTANHGIDGRSRQSYVVVGYTFANGATEATGRAGVYGIDSGTGQYNTGVIGKSGARSARM